MQCEEILEMGPLNFVVRLPFVHARNQGLDELQSLRHDGLHTLLAGDGLHTLLAGVHPLSAGLRAMLAGARR